MNTTMYAKSLLALAITGGGMPMALSANKETSALLEESVVTLRSTV
jgi:hypothetical protein